MALPGRPSPQTPQTGPAHPHLRALAARVALSTRLQSHESVTDDRIVDDHPDRTATLSISVTFVARARYPISRPWRVAPTYEPQVAKVSKIRVPEPPGGRRRAAGDEQRAAGIGQQATSSRRRATGTGRPAAGDQQQASGDRQQATSSGRRATGSRRRAAGGATWGNLTTRSLPTPVTHRRQTRRPGARRDRPQWRRDGRSCARAPGSCHRGLPADAILPSGRLVVAARGDA
jgi:hypothetical protein